MSELTEMEVVVLSVTNNEEEADSVDDGCSFVSPGLTA